MELSGHSPFIVFDDVDLNKVTDMAITSNLEITGKFYIAKQILYSRKEKDEFANLMVQKTKKLKIGNGMDKDTLLGPLCTKQRLKV